MRIHTYTRAFCSRHWCRLYIAPLSPRMSIISLQAHQSPSSFRGPPLSLSIVQSLQARAFATFLPLRLRRTSVSTMIPLSWKLRLPPVPTWHAYTHTHIHTHDAHYFIGRNERLVLSFVLCTASRLVRVSCNVRRGRGDRREKNRRRKGGKEDGPSIIIHVYTRIFTYINTRTREFFPRYLYISVSLWNEPLGAGKRFSPLDEVRACFPFVVDRLLYYISLSCTITQYCFQIK